MHRGSQSQLAGGTLKTAWYAVRVRSNFEHSCAGFLTGSGFEVFLPTYAISRRWSDRTKTISVPLFSGYLFCRMDFEKRLPVLQAPGVVDIVAFGKNPAPISDAEVDAVRTMVNSGVPVTPWPWLKVGQTVRVDRGPLAGLTGVLVNVKSTHRLVIGLDLLRRSVAAEVSIDCIAATPNTPAQVGSLKNDSTARL